MLIFYKGSKYGQIKVLIAVGFSDLKFNLKTAVEREKDVQVIGVTREYEKRVVTLLVMSAFSCFSGASRTCADFRDSTAVFRFKLTGNTATQKAKIISDLHKNDNELSVFRGSGEVPPLLGFKPRYHGNIHSRIKSKPIFNSD